MFVLGWKVHTMKVTQKGIYVIPYVIGSLKRRLPIEYPG